MMGPSGSTVSCGHAQTLSMATNRRIAGGTAGSAASVLIAMSDATSKAARNVEFIFGSSSGLVHQLQHASVEVVVNFAQLHHAPAGFAAADARDDDGHQLDGLAERQRRMACAQQLNEGQELRAEGGVGVGGFEGQLALRPIKMHGAEAAVSVVNRGERHLRAAAVREVDDVGAGLLIRLRADEARAE